MNGNTDQFCTVAEFAAMYRCSPKTIYKGIALGLIPCVRLPGGRGIRLRIEDAKRAMEGDGGTGKGVN